MADDFAVLAGRCVADHAGESLRAAMKTPAGRTPAPIERSSLRNSISAKPWPAPALSSPMVIIWAPLRTQHGAPKRRDSLRRKSKRRHELKRFERR